MKRSMGGGAHRGPAPATRQRRTMRLMQGLLVLIAAGLLVLAGYSLGKVTGFEEGRRAEEIDAPRPPSLSQTVVLALLGAGSLTAALLIQGSDGVRVPTPARLEELTGRAERAATRRAERIAEGSEL